MSFAACAEVATKKAAVATQAATAKIFLNFCILMNFDGLQLYLVAVFEPSVVGSHLQGICDTSDIEQLERERKQNEIRVLFCVVFLSLCNVISLVPKHIHL